MLNIISDNLTKKLPISSNLSFRSDPKHEIIIASKEEFKIEHKRMSIFVLDLLQAKCKCTHITLYKMIS